MKYRFRIQSPIIWILALTALPAVATATPGCAIQIEAHRIADIEDDYFLRQFKASFQHWQAASGNTDLTTLSNQSGVSRRLMKQWLTGNARLYELSVREYAPALANAFAISEEQFLNAAGLISAPTPLPTLEKYPEIYTGVGPAQLALETGVERTRRYAWKKGTSRPMRWEVRALALWEARRLKITGDDAIEAWATKRYWDYGILNLPHPDGTPRWIPSWNPSPKLDHLTKWVKAPASCFLEQVVRAWQAKEKSNKLYDPGQATIYLTKLEIRSVGPQSISPQLARNFASQRQLPWHEVSEILGMSYFKPKFAMWLEWWTNEEDLATVAPYARIPIDKLKLEFSHATGGQLTREEVVRLAHVLRASPYEALMAAGYLPTEEDLMRVSSH